VLAQQIGAYHVDCNIDSLVGCVVALFTSITGKTPRFRVDGGSNAENLALQNIQVGGPAYVLQNSTAVVRHRTCTLKVAGGGAAAAPAGWTGERMQGGCWRQAGTGPCITLGTGLVPEAKV
jgi:hypothetical protein